LKIKLFAKKFQNLTSEINYLQIIDFKIKSNK
jgi:hypothetical protein